MLSLKNNTLYRSITFYLLIAIIWLYPLNIPLWRGLRICDATILLLITISIPKMLMSMRSLVFAGIGMMLYFSTIDLINLSDHHTLYMRNLGVYYKAFMPIVLSLLVWHLRPNKVEAMYLIANLVIVASLTSLWFCAHYILVTVFKFPWNIRLSFPFTTMINRYTTDSHLVSGFLAFHVVALLSAAYISRHVSTKILCGLLSACLTFPLLLSGGRVGLLSIILTFTVFIIWRLRQHLKFAVTISSLIFATAIAVYWVASKLDLDPIIKRVFLINPTNLDQSIQGRIAKLNVIVSHFDETMVALFGGGVLSQPFYWADNIIAQILRISGAIGLIGVLLGLIVLVQSICKSLNYRREVLAVLLPFGCYILTNLSTEFFFVTRSIVPVSLWLTLVYCYYKDIDKNLDINNDTLTRR